MSNRNSLEWLNDNIILASTMAKAGVPLKVDENQRYGSSSMHLAMIVYTELNNAASLNAMRGVVDGVSHSNPDTAARHIKELVHSVPILLQAPIYTVPNQLSELPQILATAYFGRTADASFSAADGSPYSSFLHRLQWLQLKVRESWNRDEMDTFDAVIDAGAKKAFRIEPRILQRLQVRSADLLPTPSAVVAAVGVALPTNAGDNAYPLGHTSFLNFVRGIDAALYATDRSVLPLTASTVQSKFLTHMRHFLYDTASQLELGILPCDQVPIVSPWYATTVMAVRQYATAVAHTVSARACEQTIETADDVTLFSLMAMAAQNDDDMPSPTSTLFNARSKSMYKKSEAQDGPWWTLLRATLSGITTHEAAHVAQRMAALPESIASVTQTAALFCVLMHTQTGMAIVGHKQRNADGLQADGLEAYPIAKKLLYAVDPICGQNALDLVMATYSGTADLDRLATNDLAFSDVGRIEDAWSHEMEMRADCGVVLEPAEIVTKPMVEHPEIVANFCSAMRSLGLQWLRMDQDAPGDGLGLTASAARRTLESIGTVQSSQHCKEWMSMSFDFARALEQGIENRKEPPLIASPIDHTSPNATGSRSSARDDEAYLRLHFRLQTENALHNARRSGMWSRENQLILAAWVACPPVDGVGAVRMFARVVTEAAMDDGAALLPVGWREAAERRGDDSVVLSALEFERALHERNTMAKDDGAHVMPMLPKHSTARAHAAAIATGPKRFCEKTVPALDGQTATAMSILKKAVADEAAQDDVAVSATPFLHGVAVSVIAVPIAQINVPEPQRLVPIVWPGKSALLARLAAFRDVTDVT